MIEVNSFDDFNQNMHSFIKLTACYYLHATADINLINDGSYQ